MKFQLGDKVVCKTAFFEGIVTIVKLYSINDIFNYHVMPAVDTFGGFAVRESELRGLTKLDKALQ